VDLGVSFAFDAAGTMATRCCVSLEANLATPQKVNVIEVSGIGACCGGPHRRSSYEEVRMKGRKFAILGIAILMAVATTAAVTAAGLVTLNYYHFAGNFTYGTCTVMTDESQTEHSFLGGHLFSTIVGTVQLQGSCSLLPGITLPVNTPVPIAAIDFFNPFNDSFSPRATAWPCCHLPPAR